MNGIGLSLLRIGIDVTGTPLGSGAYPDSIAAAKFGVKVWGAPWSPPAGDKSNDSEDNGGTLNTADYASWASVLAAFPATFKQNTGLDLYGISRPRIEAGLSAPAITPLHLLGGADRPPSSRCSVPSSRR